MTDEPVRIAFVCVENAGRSQMAAGFARRLVTEQALDEQVEIVDGGTDPAETVHDGVREAMAERGFDLSGREPTLVTQADIATATHVITMGCAADDVCPATWRGDSRDWGLADPAGRPLDEVREIREEIESRVRNLLDEIVSRDAGGTDTTTGDAVSPVEPVSGLETTDTEDG